MSSADKHDKTDDKGNAPADGAPLDPGATSLTPPVPDSPVPSNPKPDAPADAPADASDPLPATDSPLPEPVTTGPDTVGTAPPFSIVLHGEGDGPGGLGDPGKPDLKLPEAFATIEGFRPGTDKLDFSGLDADSKTEGVQDFIFDGELTATPGVGHVGWLEAGEGDFSIAFNDGSAPDPYVIQLADLGQATLAQTDFIL